MVESPSSHAGRKRLLGFVNVSSQPLFFSNNPFPPQKWEILIFEITSRAGEEEM